MIAASPEASADFASIVAGTMPVPAFLDPANIGRYVTLVGA
jgi:hypothetical protein